MTRETTTSHTFVVALLVAGAFSTLAFDFFGQALSPLFGFPALAPVPLAKQVLGVVGIDSTPLARALHYLTGLIFYPLGWMLIAEPLRQRVTPQVPQLAAAVVYGIGLWVFALYIMAHLVAGNPPFLNFGGITWVALVGHVLFAVVTVVVLRMTAWGRENDAAEAGHHATA